MGSRWTTRLHRRSQRDYAGISEDADRAPVAQDAPTGCARAQGLWLSNCSVLLQRLSLALGSAPRVRLVDGPVPIPTACLLAVYASTRTREASVHEVKKLDGPPLVFVARARSSYSRPASNHEAWYDPPRQAREPRPRLEILGATAGWRAGPAVGDTSPRLPAAAPASPTAGREEAVGRPGLGSHRAVRSARRSRGPEISISARSLDAVTSTSSARPSHRAALVTVNSRDETGPPAHLPSRSKRRERKLKTRIPRPGEAYYVSRAPPPGTLRAVVVDVDVAGSVVLAGEVRGEKWRWGSRGCCCVRGH